MCEEKGNLNGGKIYILSIVGFCTLYDLYCDYCYCRIRIALYDRAEHNGKTLGNRNFNIN